MVLSVPRLSELLSTHALFLDFDGTLAPLQDDPFTVAMPGRSADAIPRLYEAMGGALAIVSGRDIRDLSKRVPNVVWRAGGHGVDICGPGELPHDTPQPAPSVLSQGFEDASDRFEGVWCEAKGPIIAVHYRQAPEVAAELGDALARVLDEVTGYKLQAGKMVFEAKPLSANKGRAVSSLMERCSFQGRTPIMLGDDVTDEDGFEVINELGGFAVKVGDGETVAGYRLDSPEHVADWLEQGVLG